MNAVCKYLGFLVLGAVLTAPIAISTKAASQDDRHQEDNHRDIRQRVKGNHICFRQAFCDQQVCEFRWRQSVLHGQS